jgi:uncharacterized ParB-like nuclease family protein
VSDRFRGSTFDRALRQRARRRLATRLRDEDAKELLPLLEVTRRLGQFEQSYGGIQAIPIDRIVGTVDRSRDFDREFLPRTTDIETRWKKVERAFPDGRFPPIVVYEVDGSYFLEDGHHRVAIAKQRGAEYIDAEVTRLRTRTPLPPDADIGLLIHLEQERRFMEGSGLREARPEASIPLTRPYGYLELLERVRLHGFHLMKERGTVIPDGEIAGDWYDGHYLPLMEAAWATGLRELTGGARDGDVFLWLSRRRLMLAPERGGISDEELCRLAVEEIRGRRRSIVRRRG